MESRVFTVTPINDRPAGLANAIIIPFAGANFGDLTSLRTAGPLAAKVGDVGLFSEDGAPMTAAAAFNYPIVERCFIGVIAADATGAMKGIRTEIFDGKCMGRSNDVDTAAQQPKTTIIAGWAAECETEYCLKIRYESPRVYQTYGYQSLLKTYNFVSSCCGPSCACPDGDFDEVGTGITAAINEDPDQLITAVYTAESAPGVGDGFITLTGTFENEGVQGLNPTYVENNSPLQFYVGLDCGFDCNGVVFTPDSDITTALALLILANPVPAGLPATDYVFGEGLGPDVIAKELYADGWQTSPYRIPFPLSQKTLGNNFYALAANTYDVITIEYKDCHASAITAHDVASPKKAIIPVDSAAGGPAVGAALIVIMNAWLITTPTGQSIA
ncbi:MAG: hypothetical protein ABGY11_09115 [Candidatus Thioglobus sp.]